jgi:hypothetical protein
MPDRPDVQKLVDTIKSTSAILADWAEEEGGFDSVDIDTERAELITAAESLADAVERCEQERQQYQAGLERLASLEGFTAIGTIPRNMWGDELRKRGQYAEDVLCFRVRISGSAGGESADR